MHCLQKSFAFLWLLLLVTVLNVHGRDETPTSDKIERRVHNIEKSVGDPRFYRGLVMNNGFTALLISDPDTDISAASLSVAVGSLSDPKDMQGLAHFCEHTVFMGTKKYPAEGEFNKILAQNLGFSNAYTSNDDTTYYFSTDAKSFRPTLDIFAQFFIEPLFTKSAIEREVNAVNSEYEQYVAVDTDRIRQVETNAVDPNHPYYNNFGIGTKEILWDIPNSKNISVRDKLLEFHSKWYSSHLMYLTVLGKEDLNTLEELVVSLFGGIEKKDVDMPYWPDPIYTEKQLATKTIIVPINDMRSLFVKFLIPDQCKNYKSMPKGYLNALFNHEGPSSISTALKNRGWASTFSAATSLVARGIELFYFSADLTKKGVEHVDDIIKLIFQHVNMLRRMGPQEWFHDEYKNISEMHFQYKDKGSPLDYVVGLSPQMIRYKLEDILTAEHLIREWRPDLIQELLSYLRPDNMRVTLIAKEFRNKTDSLEKYFGTPYSISKIPASTLNEWQKDDLYEDFKIPPKNKFIATDFSLVPLDKNEPDQPLIIHESLYSRCWFKKDTDFRFPKAFLTIDFFSHIVISDLFYYNVVQLFVTFFYEDFIEHIWEANRANLYLTTEVTDYGFKIHLYGFNQKLHTLLKKSIEKMLTFKINPQRFEIFKEKRVTFLKNIAMEQPYESAMRYNYIILSENAWTIDESLAIIDYVEVEDIEEFKEKFFSHMFMEILIYGNVDKIKALEFIQLLEKPFLDRKGFRKLLPHQMIRSREIQLEDGENILFEKTNDYHRSSAVHIELQCDIRSIFDYLVVRLFSDIIRESCFDTLRTQEQLGYVVFCFTYITSAVQGIHIVVQSNRTPLYIDTRIENYIDTIQDLLINMPEEEFDKHKDALAVSFTMKPKGMMEQMYVYQIEIDTQDYNFNRTQTVVELKSITKNHIVEFYHNQISRSAPKRRKLAIHVKSTLKNYDVDLSQVDNSLLTNNSLIITDITDFKKKHRLCSLSSPFTPVRLSTKSKL